MKIGAIKDWAKPGEISNFGQIKLKPMQIAILKCNKAHDVLVNLPTGFGKSLLFQYPAAQLQNKCIVVFVPLKALLWDCLKEAEQHNLTASQCDSIFIRKYQEHRFLPQLLFLTPERLFQNQTVMSFVDLLHSNNQIELFVIDEAHCISEWGSDFRPDYAKLGQLKSLFPGVRLLGMSATIPPQALKDLISRLQIVGCYYFQSSSNRPNLIYEVMHAQKAGIPSKILQYIKKKQLKQESGIIYCQTIKNSEEVFKQLKKSDMQCCLFHSKLPEKKREDNFDQFMRGEIKCIVATICFGMGVNKKNIRYVINAGVSLSAENYYQESGRAGRDGEMSYCLLLTYKSDIQPLQFLINQTTQKITLAKRRIYKLQQLKIYAKATECRKKSLFKLLGQEFSADQCKKTCDFCVNGLTNIIYEQIDFSEKGYFIIQEMQNYKQTFTKVQLVGFLKGKDSSIKNKIMKQKFKKIFEFLKENTNEMIELLVQTMLTRGLLVAFSERFKFRGGCRYVEYLKPCTRSEFNKQKSTPLLVKTSKQLNKMKGLKTDKQALPNLYSKRFEKYLVTKSKSLDKCEFEVEFEKNETQKTEIKKQQQDEDLKEIKMVDVGVDYQKFFDELFPENMPISKNEDFLDEDNEIELMNASLPEDCEDILQTELQNPYLEKKVRKSKSYEEREAQVKIQQQFQKKSVEQKKKNDSDSDDSLFELIKRKKQELQSKSQQQKEGRDAFVRKKLAQKRQFL